MSGFRARHVLLLLAVVLLALVGLGVPRETGRADTETVGLLWLTPPTPSAAVGSNTIASNYLKSSPVSWGP